MPSRRVALLMSLLMISGTGLPAQQPVAPDSDGVATIRTTARLVVLDVVVTDGHGHPVKGLKAEDFALSENGKPQTLKSFVEHDAEAVPGSPESAPAEDLPPNTYAVHAPVAGNGAVTVIVLGNLAFEDAPYVRDQLKAYLKTAAPETPIAIFRQDFQGMHLVQGFTADPKVLQEAAASKRILPPLGFLPPGTIPVRGSLQLSQYLNRIPGRVNVIWFSSGGTDAPRVGGIRSDDAFADVSTFVRDLKGSTSVLRLSRVAVYPVDAGGLKVEAPSMPPVGLFADIENAPIFNNAHLAELAEGTGGKAFYNNNGFKQAIAEVVRTGAEYYTVSYTPTNQVWDGSYRSIKVDVGGYPDATPSQSWVMKFFGWIEDEHKVEYRRGYFARDNRARPTFPAGFSSASGSAPPDQPRLISVSPRGGPMQAAAMMRAAAIRNDPLQRGMAFASETPVDIYFKATVTPSVEVDRVKPGATLPKDNFLTAAWKDTPYRNYHVHYSIATKDLHLDADVPGRHQGRFKFVIVVYRDNGEPVNSIASTVTVNASDAEYVQMLKNGMNFDQTVAIPTKINTTVIPVTANFFVRAGIEELETGRVGAIEVPVEWMKVLPGKSLAAVSPDAGKN